MTEDNRSFKTDDPLATLGTAQAQARVSLDFANTVAIQAHQAAIAAEMGSRIISPGTAHLEFSTTSPLVLLQGAFQLQTVIDRIEKVPEGHLVEVVMLPWLAIYREITRNPGFIH